MSPYIHPTGDSALTITFSHLIDDNINEQVVSLHNLLAEQRIAGIKDLIPTYASLTVVYDVSYFKKDKNESAGDVVSSLIYQALHQQHSIENQELKTHHVPICYHPTLGVDLMNISNEKEISVEEIIELHHQVNYRVYMLGFLPGFPYLGQVNNQIATPRKATPETVTAGSVGIAGNQTGIYPFNSPGGWNIIGQTPQTLFYPQLKDPCLFHPGDLVKFVPITLEEFHELKQAG